MPSVAKYLITCIFAINVCFFAYLCSQFFASKDYGNGLHSIYVAIVLATTVLLGVSTREVWAARLQTGGYYFFAALAISFVGNLASQWFV